MRNTGSSKMRILESEATPKLKTKQCFSVPFEFYLGYSEKSSKSVAEGGGTLSLNMQMLDLLSDLTGEFITGERNPSKVLQVRYPK